MLEWSVRRITSTMLLRYFKTTAPAHFTSGLTLQNSKEVMEDHDESVCFEWQNHQDFLLTEVIERLKTPRLFYFLTLDSRGSIKLVPALFGLQMKDSLKNTKEGSIDENELNNLNLMYQLLTEKNIKINPTDNSISYSFLNETNEESFHNLDEFMDPSKVINLDDIEDLSYYYLDEKSSESLRLLLKLHSNYFFYYFAEKNKEEIYFPMLAMAAACCATEDTFFNSNFISKKNFLIYILKFKSFESPLYMLSCSIFDYQELFFDIQNLILVQSFKKKLKQSSCSYKREKLNKGCIAHSSVLQAMNLLE